MRQTLCARIPRELVDTKFKRLRDVGADPLARRLTIHGLQSASSTRYVEARSPRWRDPVAMDPTRGLREEQSFSEFLQEFSQAFDQSLATSTIETEIAVIIVFDK